MDRDDRVEYTLRDGADERMRSWKGALLFFLFLDSIDLSMNAAYKQHRTRANTHSLGSILWKLASSSPNPYRNDLLSQPPHPQAEA